MANNDQLRRDIEGARHSVYVGNTQMRCMLHAYLDMLAASNAPLVERLREKLKDRDAELSAAVGVRDAIVYSALDRVLPPNLFATISDLVEKKIAEEEPDEDLRELRLGLFRTAAAVH